VLGGAAGYKQLSVASFPTRRSDFGRWVASTLLNPSHALFREDEYLLAEDSEISSRSLYRSAISALASGERTPTRLGGRLGRDRTSLSHLLGVLQRSGWVRREVDLFNERSVEYEVIDPIIRFSSLVIGPNRARLEERQGLEVWTDVASTWRANIVGPHFETLAREWMTKFASRSTLGGIATKVGRLHLNDRAQRSKVELDACALDQAGNLLAIGEAKATSDKRTVADIERLMLARTLAPDSSGSTRLFLFSMNGFTSDAIAKGNAEGVELVDLRRLYEGD
jgi:uncharacterized protein